MFPKKAGAGGAPKGMNPKMSVLDDLEKELVAASLHRIKNRNKPVAPKPGDPPVEQPDSFKDEDASESPAEEAAEEDGEAEPRAGGHPYGKHAQFGKTKTKVRIPAPRMPGKP